MRAMSISRPGERLRLVERDIPVPGPNQVLVRVRACGVCRTDLHLVDGELPLCSYPIIPGHEIVGEIAKLGPGSSGFGIGERVGVPWLASTCRHCRFCLSGEENLCDEARFTGCHVDGGYQDYVLADYRYCFRLPGGYEDAEAAPLLCAGLIGHRAHRMAGAAERLGIYGFGAAAHIIAQVAAFQGQRIFAFTRAGDRAAQEFAMGLGAEWAGDSDIGPPEPLDAAIIFAPVGPLVPAALRAVRKGGRVITAGIHMSEIPAFAYSILWGERMVRSVANLTRADGEEFMRIADQVPIRTSVTPLPLDQANEALDRLRSGDIQGAAVLIP
ncbi:MAG: zinc-dependent alcohol dehydrogenase family protein [Bauldia sp.]|uniref:zinc-dependent alcohol dehydrogenase family protein n=1 Tax=Bauldia sp. TaxID=2575872 RepID=UPI001DF27ACC|nr:zinc-dependent alcohol dehydrogenase family protein [Bauldia sp.]MCB1496005.1 zinc-dependent alcohol dehydrogenase family protein [Bauldia sp.]